MVDGAGSSVSWAMKSRPQPCPRAASPSALPGQPQPGKAQWALAQGPGLPLDWVSLWRTLRYSQTGKCGSNVPSAQIPGVRAQLHSTQPPRELSSLQPLQPQSSFLHLAMSLPPSLHLSLPPCIPPFQGSPLIRAGCGTRCKHQLSWDRAEQQQHFQPEDSHGVSMPCY